MAKRPPTNATHDGTNIEASRAGTAEYEGMGTIPQTTIDPDSIVTIDEED